MIVSVGIVRLGFCGFGNVVCAFWDVIWLGLLRIDFYLWFGVLVQWVWFWWCVCVGLSLWVFCCLLCVVWVSPVSWCFVLMWLA